jgi:hypothetical protein
VEFLYDRWQSDSALVQGCTTRAEAYACTLQIVVPLADRAPCANGLWQNCNHLRKGSSRDRLVPNARDSVPFRAHEYRALYRQSDDDRPWLGLTFRWQIIRLSDYCLFTVVIPTD